MLTLGSCARYSIVIPEISRKILAIFEVSPKINMAIAIFEIYVMIIAIFADSPQ
jgi:hypothetical protein